MWHKFIGIPLHAWSEEFFTQIGSFYGEFLHSNEETKIKVRMDIATFVIWNGRFTIPRKVL